MKKKVSIWYLVGLIILVIVVTYISENHNDKVFQSKIDTLENERSQLRKDRLEYLNVIDSLSNEIEGYIHAIDSLDKEVQTIKTKRNEIPTIVDSMLIIEVDSILTGYVHPR